MGKNHSYIMKFRGRVHVVQVVHVLSLLIFLNIIVHIIYVLSILIFLNIHTHVAHVAHGLIRLNILNMFTEHRARLLNRLARISNPHDH